MVNIQCVSCVRFAAVNGQDCKNSIGMDDYFDRFFFQHETQSNYPPYNLVQLNNVESILEIALAGFKQDEVNVYTEYGSLFVEGQKEAKEPKP